MGANIKVNLGTTYEVSTDGNHISESLSRSDSHIEVKGTSYNSNDTGALYIKYNEQDRNDVQTITNTSRGLTLVVWSSSMDHIGTWNYDVYGSETAKNNLASFLNTIMGNSGTYNNVFFALASFDAIGTNSNLASAMTNAGAWEWFNQGNTSNGPTHRHPYAAIGFSRLGILKEQMHTNTSGADPAYVSYAPPTDVDKVGGGGYGEPIFADLPIYSGNSYPFKTYISTSNWSDYSVTHGEKVMLTGALKCNDVALNMAAYVRIYIVGRNNAGSWGNSVQWTYKGNEWTRFQLFYEADLVNYPKFSVHVYHFTSSNTTGLAYAKDMEMQKAGFEIDTANSSVTNADRSTIGVNSISASYIKECPWQFGTIGDPKTYYNAWNSPANILTTLNSGNPPNLGDSKLGSGFDTNNVRWFDKELTNRNEYSIHEGKNFSGDSNRYNDTGYVDIDHTKLYVACIWMNNLQKDDTGGYNYFGCHTRNSSNGTTTTQQAYSSGGTTNPYFFYPQGANIEKNKWSLMMGWMVPSNWTQTQGTNFYNKVWSKFGGYYENGRAGDTELYTSGPAAVTGSNGSNGGNVRVGQWNSTDAKFHLRWLDYYNTSTINGGEHKTWWALPAIFEVDPAYFSFTNGHANTLTGGGTALDVFGASINIDET
jgi:hypothetical protein